MADENKDNPDIYVLRDPSTLTEKFIAPPENSEIFAIKESIIGVTLGAGISLCNTYRIDKRLSKNEAGETWKASDLAASRNVLVYLPPLSLRTDAAAMESVSQTARHIEALEHPRIVPLMESLTDPEHGFFAVRKFVNGKSLDLYRKEYIKRYKKFAPSKTVKFLNDAAHALDYAHSVRIVHGDLCPQNIIIGLDDEVYVDNFVLLPPQTFCLAEKKPYLAPEITEGQNTKEHNITIASDIFALAVVAYELLSGRLPLSSESMEDTPLPIPNVPSAVDAVIRKAMAKDPDDRYHSCGEFVKALEQGFQQSARIKSVIETSSSVSSKNKFSSGIIFGSALAAVLCVAGIALWQAQTVVEEVAKKPVPEHVEVTPVKPITTVETPIEKPTPKPVEVVEPIPPIDPPAVPPKTVTEFPIVENPVTETTIEQQTVLPANNPEIEIEPNTTPLILDNITQESESPLANVLSEPTEGEIKQIPIGGLPATFHCCKDDAGYFWIQETPVTQEMWEAYVMTIPEGNSFNPKLPVVKVSWEMCQDFVNKINALDVLANEQLTGHVFALPSESQWNDASPYEKDSQFAEWCDDWLDEAKQARIVRGSGNYRDSRDPKVRFGFSHIGFRLAIVPKKMD